MSTSQTATLLPPEGAPSPPQPSRFNIWLGAALLLLAGYAAYHNSFGGPFVFDDLPSIVRNSTIQDVAQLARVLNPPLDTTVSARPVANLTLALNHAMTALNPSSYHWINLVIHLSATLALFGLVRQILLLPALHARFSKHAFALSLSVATIWSLHPLQTESVTYVIQRVESLMALWYLLTAYAFVRGAQADLAGNHRAAAGWRVASVASCLLGVGSKEVIVSAPVIVLMIDQLLVAGSLRYALSQRGKYYLALFATWIPLALLVLSTESRSGTAGFGTASSLHYLLTQCEAIVHYLRLAVWPTPLVFDYGKGLVTSPATVAVQGTLLLLLAAGIVFGFLRRSPWSLLGVFFFAVLAPSSSVLPVATQTMAEHRMYLPLAALAAAAVLSAFCVFGARSLAVWPIAAVVLGAMTVERNRDYRDELTLWEKTATSAPANPRALATYGHMLFRAGRANEAIPVFERALVLDRDYFDAHNNLGIALLDRGRVKEAHPHFEAAVKLEPEYAQARSNLGMALHALGRDDEAASHCAKAVGMQPAYAEARSNYGVVLHALRRYDEALRECAEAVRLNPTHAANQNNLGITCFALGRLDEAQSAFKEALRLNPSFADAQGNLGKTLSAKGDYGQAIEHFRIALREKPDAADYQYGLGNALVKLRRWSEALAPCRAAARLEPSVVEAHTNLGTALFFTEHVDEAIACFETALALQPDSVKAHYFLGNVFASIGRVAEAKSHYQAALKLNPNYGPARQNLAQLQ